MDAEGMCVQGPCSDGGRGDVVPAVIDAEGLCVQSPCAAHPQRFPRGLSPLPGAGSSHWRKSPPTWLGTKGL